MATLVLVHGAWMTPLCWERFQGFYEKEGHQVLAPAWPGKDRSVEEVRRDPTPLAGLGLKEIVDSYERVVRDLGEPLLIGHSFGGLVVQQLLDRGLGAAGVAIDSAPPRGVLAALYPSSVRANASVLFTPGGWSKVVHMSPAGFRYAFVNTLAEADAQAAYDRYVVPETGRIFFQSAFFSKATAVNFRNRARAPLLLIAGGRDHIIPAGLNRENLRRYVDADVPTDFKEFADRTHWTIAQDGWEDVARYTLDWFGKIGAV